MIELHGHPVSQPTRAVLWLCMINGAKVDLKMNDPISGGTQTREFLQLNPAGLIPTLKEGDFVLFESNAIMIYLCEKYNWNQWYPNDLKLRAKIHQYMNWHHHNTRKSSLVFRSMMLLHFGMGGEEQQKILNKKQRILTRPMQMLELWLTKTTYLVSNDHATVADLLCYCELDQLKAMDLFDFTSYPHLKLWMEKMEKLPKHEETHRSLNRLVIRMKSKL